MGSCPSGLRQDGSSWGTRTCPCGTRGEPGSRPWPPRRRSSCVSVSPAPSLLTQHLCSFAWSLVLSLPFAAQLCPSLSLSRSLRPADNGTAESVSAAGVPRGGGGAGGGGGGAGLWVQPVQCSRLQAWRGGDPGFCSLSPGCAAPRATATAEGSRPRQPAPDTPGAAYLKASLGHAQGSAGFRDHWLNFVSPKDTRSPNARCVGT